MMTWHWIKKLFIEPCPNCISALQYEEDTDNCVMCSNSKGETTGWIWAWWVDPFGIITKQNIKYNLRKKYPNE